MPVRAQIQVRGIVQSVGFRPFVYARARAHGLAGIVLNNEQGVLIDIEGEPASIDRLLDDLRTQAPALARVDSVEWHNYARAANYQDFQIIRSRIEGKRFVPVSPDVATCADCLRELFDKNDRRYRYPFINCTNCGPRFTIIEDIPYDRAKTTMREFRMCDECRTEYDNPLDRRFHAEPTACGNCGPQVYLTAKSDGFDQLATGDQAINRTIELLREGNILAIKGVGGFHLACDALNENAVNTLRQRKYREDKPFAVMARSAGIVKEHCEMSTAENVLLCSIERPIVLLKRKPTSPIPSVVAPGVKTLGFMLPYSPLHHLLLEQFDQPLVMTSANISDEPICYQNDDASRRLANIADFYLMHNRRIHMRTDDSVVRVFPSPTKRRNHSKRAESTGQMVLRRSRGYGPAPIKTKFRFSRQILACGAELKNTFCLTRDNYAFISHHIGDLENLETLRSFTEGIEHFKRLFCLEPEVVVYDLHPEYLSTKYALAEEVIETKIPVQHHHAHIASCMADNCVEGDVIGVAMDGLGFGLDNRMWGGEFFVANFEHAERLAHLDYLPMPGGAKAIREPWRMAAVYLEQVFGSDWLNLNLPFVTQMNKNKWAALRSMIESGANSPETSSIGRLFDSIAALLCLRNTVKYEGQAAIELESLADTDLTQKYQFHVSQGGSIISAQPLVREVVVDIGSGVSSATVSAKFHAAVADLIWIMARRIRSEYGLNRIVLSGGVFQNMILLSQSLKLLAQDGFAVFTHQRVPPNDGGISLGQAVIANAGIVAGKI